MRARRGRIKAVGLLSTIVLLVPAMAQVAPAAGDDGARGRPRTSAAKPVPVSPVEGRRAPTSKQQTRGAARSRDLQDRRVTWPTTGRVVVGGAQPARRRLGAVEVATLNGAEPITATVLSQDVSRKAGVAGVLVELETAASASSGAKVTTDYAQFAHAYGADWAGRLQVLAYPGCLITTPGRPECQRASPVDWQNDTATSTMTATLPPRSTGGATVLAMAATAASATGTGDFSATPMAASSTWTAGGSSGDFTWEYPMRLVPSNNGPSPDLNLTYSSQSVDGRTSSTNNQSSIVGEGFNLSSSFIERGYMTCKDDGQAGKYDLCWKNDNAMMTLNGVANELIKTGDGTWRLSKDDGTRVRRLTSTSTYNLDNDKEYWEVTSPDGTKFFFGRTTASGQTGDTRSIWTVPVFGDDPGEPCYNAVFASASCNQAWRWNLDYVVDPSGNAMSLWYTAEDNFYAKNRVASPGAKYVRGGRLDRVDYGLRDGATNTNPPFRVNYNYDVRCFDTATNCGTYSKAKWPDTPYDQICNSGAACTGKFAPTFFTRFRLKSVTTSIRKAAAYSNVDTWTFNQEFLNPGVAADGTLWLKGISHTGLVGGTASVPDVTFGAVQLTNRVDNSSDGLDPLPRYRVRTISSESGGLTTVNYSDEQCTPSNKPTSADANTMRCFPQRWTPEGNTSPRTDWFHKYVVDSVSDTDMTALAPPMTTYFSYMGGAAWAYDDNKLVADEYRTWSTWRGYEKVKTVTGTPGFTDQQGQQTTTYFRGMNGDKQSSGPARSAEVAASDGSTVVDRRELAGMERESVDYSAEGGVPVAGAITTPWVKVTAGSGQKTAAHVATAKVESRAILSDGTWRRRVVSTTYDDESGQPIRVSDTGDLAVDDDQVCVATTYVDTMTPTGTWKVGYASRTVESRGLCGADALSPSESKALSDTRTRYDNLGQGVAPTAAGRVTEVDRLSGYAGSSPTYQLVSKSAYDAWGRPTSETVPTGTSGTSTRTTATAYTMSAEGTVVGATKTEDVGGKAFVTTTVIAPEWNATTKVTDPNGKVTTASYDPLGRIVSVWQPNRAATATPSIKYSYAVSKTAASAVRTSVLNKEGTGYLESVALHDALMRPRQLQTPSPDGGRIISGTAYDGRGLATQAIADVYAAGAPSTTLAQFDDGVVPALTKMKYDGQGRQTRATLYTFNTVRWASTVDFAGSEKARMTPPDGAPSTTTYTDVRGRVVRSVEHGTPDLVTTTRYDLRDNVVGITSPGGTWGYEYDIRGRKVASHDPDSGSTAVTYTENDLVSTTTDANGKTLLTTYDNLDRRTALYDGTSADSAKQRAAWTYDTVAKGYPTAETRFVGGASGDKFTSTIAGYNALYKQTDVRFSVTKSAGTQLLQALPGNLNFAKSMVYNVDQSVDVVYLPKVTVGTQTPLTMEAVQYGYNNVGLLKSMSGRTGIVQDTVYDELGQVQQYVLGTGPAAQIYVNQYHEAGTRRLTRSLAVPSTSGAVISDLRYSYDDVGNPLKEADTASGDVQCYRYDDHRRLTEAWTPDSDDCATNPSTSSLGGPAPYWQSWSYTATGLRQSQTARTPTSTQTDTYSYPAAGSPHANFATAVDRTGDSPAALEYTHDQAGNTTARPGPDDSGQQELEWDSEGNLAKLTTESGAETRYVYGLDGSLLVKDDSDATTIVVGETEIRLNKADSKVEASRNYAGPGGSMATRTSDSKIDFLVADPQGTAAVAVDGSSLTPTRRFRTPFGASRGTTPDAWPNRHGFLDKLEDTDTGLTSIGAREYDADTGRFISVDPLLDPSSPGQMLGYTYANNNPKAFSDPSGLMYMDQSPGGSRGSSSGPRGGGGLGSAANTAAKSVASDLAGYAFTYAATSGRVGVNASSKVPPAVKAARERIGAEMESIGNDKGQIWQRKNLAAGLITSVADLVDLVLEARVADYPEGYLGTKVDNYFHGQGYGGGWYTIGRFLGPPIPFIGFGASAMKAGVRALRTVDKAVDGARIASGAAKTAARACSFAGTTTVLMADGTRKPIEDVEVGDKVIATDPETGEQVTKKVEHVWVHDDTVSDLVIDGEVISTTEDHPFWSVTDQRFERADELSPGEKVLTADGREITVSELRLGTARTALAYNLSIEGIHTYHVGDAGILVHNVCPWSIRSRLKAAGPGTEMGLPSSGKIRFVPDRGYNPATPLPRGPQNGYVDRFGNEWVVGPSRTAGHPFEWDVQLSLRGRQQLGWLSGDNRHLNVSPFGEVTH